MNCDVDILEIGGCGVPVNSSPPRWSGMWLQATTQRDNIPAEEIQYHILILLGDFWPM